MSLYQLFLCNALENRGGRYNQRQIVGKDDAFGIGVSKSSASLLRKLVDLILDDYIFSTITSVLFLVAHIFDTIPIGTQYWEDIFTFE